MNTKKSIAVLNKLVEINNDRLQGYNVAIDESEDAELQILFADFKEISDHCIAELSEQIAGLGGLSTDSSSSSGKLYRIWMDIKAAVTNNDRNAILSSCEYGEDVALETYNDVLTNDIDFLTIEQHKMIYKQYVSIKNNHDKLKVLRDLELEHHH